MNTSIILAISTPIGVILGSIITLIGNNINNKAQRKREKETFQLQPKVVPSKSKRHLF